VSRSDVSQRPPGTKEALQLVVHLSQERDGSRLCVAPTLDVTIDECSNSGHLASSDQPDFGEPGCHDLIKSSEPAGRFIVNRLSGNRCSVQALDPELDRLCDLLRNLAQPNAFPFAIGCNKLNCPSAVCSTTNTCHFSAPSPVPSHRCPLPSPSA